jgi:hypothetical protein
MREPEVRLLFLKNLYIFATGCSLKEAGEIFRKLMLQISFSTTIIKETHNSVNKSVLNKAQLLVNQYDKKQGKCKTSKQATFIQIWKESKVS